MDINKKELGSRLAYAALDEVPEAKSNAKEVVGLVKTSGRVTGYQLSDGSEYNNLGNLPAISADDVEK